MCSICASRIVSRSWSRGSWGAPVDTGGRGSELLPCDSGCCKPTGGASPYLSRDFSDRGNGTAGTTNPGSGPGELFRPSYGLRCRDGMSVLCWETSPLFLSPRRARPPRALRRRSQTSRPASVANKMNPITPPTIGAAVWREEGAG
jgi:hypothetical protein